MKRVAVLSATFLYAASASVAKQNPMGTVLALLEDLTAKITADGEAEGKAYQEYVEWCDDVAKNSGYAIETGTKAKAKLEAQIGELTSDIKVGISKVDDLASAVAAADQELSDASLLRKKEESDFTASEKELTEAIDALSRAIRVLESEMSKNPALAQIDTSSMSSTIRAIGVVLDAAALGSSDKRTLLALAQSQSSDDDDDSLGEPAAATYKTHSSNILDVLEDMKEKAEGQLSDLRKAETNARQNFNMLKQSLEDQAAADTKTMGRQKSNKAAAEESKATAEGDLEITIKSLATSEKQKSMTQSTCLRVAADHETTLTARKEELSVLAQAKQILSETSSGAVSQTYSLLQMASVRMLTRQDMVASEVVEEVRQLAKHQHSSALAQLASRIAAVARFGASNGDDVFAKIKGLIRDMIFKLEKEAGDEATEKAYCDEQIAKTEFKKGELEDDIAKKTSRIDQAAARSVQLKGEIKALQDELAALAKQQAEMDKMRFDEHAEYTQAKEDLELGISGVRKALALLRDYYGDASLLQAQQPAQPEIHSKSIGGGGSIINILEVCESDFATDLAQEETTEADAQSTYEKNSQENAVTKTIKEQDVKYKTQEAKAQDSTVSEYSADRQSTSAEYSAVLEYYSKIKERCIAKPQTYEERRRRREAEIEGLKQALTILKEETALLQRKKHNFRGSLSAM